MFPVLSLAVVGTFTGCLSRPAIDHQTFALSAESTTQNTNATGRGVLMLRSVQVSPLFEHRSFVYRVGPDMYESDPYSEFIIPPGRALSIPVRACLQNSGVFEDVVESTSEIQPDSTLEVHARELYGDFRKPAEPAAVLALTLWLFETPAGENHKLIYHKDYARRVALKDRTPVALAAGWNQALSEIMTQACADIASARGKTIAR